MRIKLLIGLLVLGVLLISVFLLPFGCIKTPSLVVPPPDCEPEPEKNKVAVVIAKDGIYDTGIMNSQISAYYEAVKKDLNIENVGLKKFDGETISELDKFAEELYQKIMERPPDPDGFAHTVEEIQNDMLAERAAAMLNSQEFFDRFM